MIAAKHETQPAMIFVKPTMTLPAPNKATETVKPRW